MDKVFQDFNKAATTLLCEEGSIWSESKSMGQFGHAVLGERKQDESCKNGEILFSFF